MSESKSDLTGQRNVYICPAKHRTVTIDRDKGVTPMMLSCKHEGCQLMAKSCFYPTGLDLEPEYEWYKPTLEELHAEVRKFCRKEKLNYRNTLPQFWEHWNQGGLSLRKIVKPGYIEEAGPVSQEAFDSLSRRKEMHAIKGATSPIKAGRNDSCPCGSGKKYKHCCLKLQSQ
jgi:hypothetical protein